MPNIYISHHRIRVELVSLAVCFLIATGLNIYAIIHYKSPFSELWTSILYVLMATAFFYAVWTLLRLLVYGIKRIVNHKS
ncbi:MAG: hypothetical protein IKH91_01295 [Prevotella sp.]|jgi:hypothetical protein|nr:hypothetical protein [Prevotella sp.]